MAFDPDKFLAKTESPTATQPKPTGFDPDSFLSKTTTTLVDDDKFDPVGYAVENPGDAQFAKDVAWQRKQRPFTMDRAKKLPGIAGEAAVGIVKDFGAGMGNIAADTVTQFTDPTEANRERAATQQMARAQLIENNSESFLTKLFGPNTFFGKVMQGSGSNANVANAMMMPGASSGGAPLAEQALADQAKVKESIDAKDADPRKAFDQEFDNRIRLAAKERDLLAGKVKDEGITADAMGIIGVKPSEVVATPEELASQGAPVDSEAIRTGAVAADPINLAPLGIPRVAPALNKVAGAALKVPAAALKGAATAAEKAATVLPSLTSKAVTVGKYGLGGVLGAEALNDPGKALEHLGMITGAVIATKAGGAALKGAAKGSRILGQVIDNAGAKLINPKSVSAAERAGAQAVMDIEAQGGGAIAKAVNPAANLADADRMASRVIGGAVSAPVAMAPLNAAISDNPEEFAQLSGGAAGFGAVGGATSYNPVKGFRPDVVQAVDTILRDNGAKKSYGTPLDAKSNAWLASAPASVRDGVNAYKGFFDGFKLANGKEPQIYVLPAQDFAAQVQTHRADVPLADAAQQRGFATPDGQVFINGDYAGEAGRILGHEAGGHVAESIMQVLAPELSKAMGDTAQKGLLENGKPTAKLRKFIDAYNLEFDPTGKTKEIATNERAISEWLAEQAASVLSGEGPAKFAAGESIRQNIADNLGDYFKGIFGAKNDFAREEIPTIAGEYRDLLYELGRLGTRVRGGEEIPVGQVPPATETPIDPVAPAPTPATEVAPAPAAEVASPIAPEVAPPAPAKSPKPLTDPLPGEGPYAATAEESTALEALGWTPEDVSVMAKSQVDAELGRPPESQPLKVLKVAEKPLAEIAPVDAAEPERALSSVKPAEQAVAVNSGDLSTVSPVADEPAPSVSTSPAKTIPKPSTERGALAEVDARPAVPPVSQEQIDAALEKAEAAAAPKQQRARSEKRKGEIAKEERVKSLTDLLPTEGETLRREVNPDTGEQVIRGNIVPANPLHAAILRELGTSEAEIQTIQDLQAANRKGIYLRDYNSAAQEGFETGENLDFSGAKRGEEYQASQTSQERGKREGAVSKQDKGFTPLSTILGKDGPVVRGFDHDKFLNNVRSILDGAAEAVVKTGLEGLSQPARDKAIADAFRKVTENHQNAWKGDGSAALKTFPDSAIKQNLDYVGQKVDKQLAEVVNMALHNRSAVQPAEPKAKTELAQKKYAARSSQSQAARALADFNQGFLNEATGETNRLRDELSKKGFDPDKQLKPTISNIRPDLIEGGISDSPSSGKTVHAHGFDITPQDLTVAGLPNPKIAAAGFLPGISLSRSKAVRDENFQRWFGNSKTVDDSGKPLTLFHGTRGVFPKYNPEFTVFNPGASGGFDLGIHFGNSEQADHFATRPVAGNSESGAVYPVHLKIENPLRLDDTFGPLSENIKETSDQLLEKKIISKKEYDEIVNPTSKEPFVPDQWKKIESLIKSAGHDGVVYQNTREGSGSDDSYIVFEPTQIKSATGNRGSFSSSNPDIRFLPGKKSGQLADFGKQDELGFTSTLQRVIADKIPNRATPEQILATLDPSKSGVKAEEIDQMGLREWLQSKGEKVSKDELQDFVKAGGAQLHEVTKQEVSAERLLEINKRLDEISKVRRRTTLTDHAAEEFDALMAEKSAMQDNPPKFAQYTLPGGENYKEVLLTLPEKGFSEKESQERDALKNKPGRLSQAEMDRLGVLNGRALGGAHDSASQFRSSHWDEPNVLAHIRQADHTDADGNKVRLIEELQSDAHQSGRKKGYQPESPDGVPNFPFKKSWTELAFKRALRMAVEDGADSIAWVKGEDQAARYDLSKSIDQIQWIVSDPKKSPDTGKLYAYKDGTRIIERDATASDLPDIIGKDLAQKLIDEKPIVGSRNAHTHALSGLDLKTGGEGMKGFYDKILPDFVKKYVKKWGGKVETATLDGSWKETEDGSSGHSPTVEVHAVKITPEMREAVMQGQPMFLPGSEPSKDLKVAKTWFVRDGKRVYHQRSKDGKFAPKSLTLARVTPSAITPRKDDDSKKQLAGFKP